eukprot:Tbor_TRINITY_DN2480_c0_g1::TRINITY_DN2480_c0_g1_i1::g.2574::m.2574/K01410/MIPEP; mitochondrial intermediate peptidase
MIRRITPCFAMGLAKSCSSQPYRYVSVSQYPGVSGKVFTGDENAPILSFLSSPDDLLDTVQGTIEKSTELLEQIKKTSVPQDKHDLIDSTSNVLCLLLDPCEFVRQIHPDSVYKEKAGEAFAAAHEFMCEVNGRRELYDVLVDLSTTKELTEESMKNLRQLKQDMESNGIHLDDAGRAEITRLNIEKEELVMKFLREKETKNPFTTLRHLLACRHKLAMKLEFESFAEQQLRGTMIENQEQVWHFLCGVAHRVRPQAERELELILSKQGEVRSREKITDTNRAIIGTSLRNEMEPSGVNSYFTVSNCLRGIQCLCSEVFGITLVEKPFLPEEFFLPHAVKFHVYDIENKFCGIIIVDMFARSSKFCQAGHLTLQLGCKPHQKVLKTVGLELGERQYPVVALTCNAGSTFRAAKSADGNLDPEGTVMLPHEVTTCFHEFGHALHTIFGQTTVQNLAGTRGSIDFVETFSQLFEQFLTDYDFLKLWAHKIGSKEPIPREIVEKRNAAARLLENLDTLDQVQLATIDQTLHGPQPFTVYFPHGDDGRMGKRTLGELSEYGPGMYNFAKIVMDASAPISVAIPTESGVLRTLSFEHLTSYPAGYYGYLYSLAIAKRIWKKKFGEKTMNREAGTELVDKVMKYGAACNPKEVLAEYLNEDLDEIDTWE